MPKRDEVRITIRIEPDLKRRIEAEAAKPTEKRSVNNMIEVLLQEALDARNRPY